MENEVSITFEGDHVHVISNGKKDIEFATRLWTDVVAMCHEKNCFDVLGISKSSKPMSTIEAFAFAELFTKLGVDNKFRIAWVELEPAARETLYFTETVLANRGFPGRMFGQVSEASEWLGKKNRPDEIDVDEFGLNKNSTE